MRLIDADELKELYEDYEGLKVPCEVVLQNIDDIPTAYDIDKVVEQLEENYSCDVGNLKMISLDKAIEIVRAGMRELKPCPFCGGEAEIEMDDCWYWNYHVFCQECKIGTDYYNTADEAIEAWNRRAGEQEWKSLI